MIVVGTTLSAMAMSDPDAGMAWLYNAEALREQTGPASYTHLTLPTTPSA